MKLDVLNMQGAATGRSVELPDEIFGVTPNDHVIYLAVKQFRAAQRQGTHKVKTRAEVQGASRKLHKQKGTGGSRKGNIRNPLYKGGGTIFGPKPHGYDFKLNRKVKDLARTSALTYKAKENAIVIVEDINMEVPKTKQLTNMFKGLNLAAKKTLVITPEYDETVYLSLRNVVSTKGVTLSDMNTYDIVNANVLVFTESAIKVFSEEEETAATAATTETPATGDEQAAEAHA